MLLNYKFSNFKMNFHYLHTRNQRAALTLQLHENLHRQWPRSVHCRRVNNWCLLHGKQNAILVSIHVNAYGNGSEWTQPHGWSIYTSKGKTAADALATCIFEAAKKYLPDMKMRTDNSDGDPDFEEAFYILRHSLCPAVLSENGFMTNEQESRWLQTRAAKQAIVDLHVEGTTEYLS